ncbi:DNA cytosine methyltransferase, partial [Streptococcus sobrinus]|uniref:DNA cytosine methyltransferase n=1 Tax=Streptococcus sobrinus TaxID=1310 RepID=UPI00036384DC
NFVYENQIRKLTPRECWHLQGFPDWAFDRARQVNSDSQLYKQAGNSVTVNVIKEIASQLEKENNNGM